MQKPRVQPHEQLIAGLVGAEQVLCHDGLPRSELFDLGEEKAQEVGVVGLVAEVGLCGLRPGVEGERGGGGRGGDGVGGCVRGEDGALVGAVGCVGGFEVGGGGAGAVEG